MTTCQDIVTRSLRRLGVVPAGQNPDDTESADALAALNDLMHGWRSDGLDLLLQGDFALTGTFVFWVPPADLTASVASIATYAGTWNASTNSPSLASSVGTSGQVYKVSVAGSTALNGLSTWSANDFLVFDGVSSVWKKGRSSRPHHAGVAALLAVHMSSEYGVAPDAVLVRDAAAGWSALMRDLTIVPRATFDPGIVRTTARGPFLTESGS